MKTVRPLQDDVVNFWNQSVYISITVEVLMVDSKIKYSPQFNRQWWIEGNGWSTNPFKKFRNILKTPVHPGKGLLFHTCFLCASLDSLDICFQKTKQYCLEDCWNASSTQLLAENWRGKWLDLPGGSFKKLKNISSCVINVNCVFMCVYLVEGFVRLCSFI